MAQSRTAPPQTDKATAILQGAMQEFLRHGYAGTSMDGVAAAAGVSKATIYSYFSDKRCLFERLVQQMAQQKFRALFEPLPLEGEPRTVLRQLAQHALDLMGNDPQMMDFARLLIGESGHFPELAQTFVSHLSKPGIDRLSYYLACHPELEIADSEAAARLFVGTLFYFMVTQKILHGEAIAPMDSERLVETLVATLTQASRA